MSVHWLCVCVDRSVATQSVLCFEPLYDRVWECVWEAGESAGGVCVCVLVFCGFGTVLCFLTFNMATVTMRTEPNKDITAPRTSDYSTFTSSRVQYV